jgi:hypothetical protein
MKPHDHDPTLTENAARCRAIQIVNRYPHLGDLLLRKQAAGGSWVRTLRALEEALEHGLDGK